MELLKKTFDFVMDILETVVFVGSIFIVVYLFILTLNQVKGVSIEPTFISGDYILTSRMTYMFRDYKRGDVIFFKSPSNPAIEYIKRIIGKPADRIKVQNNEVYVNGKMINENYISDKTSLWEQGCLKEGIDYIVPENELFVMGDNRPRSSDSREFCSIPSQSVIGHVFLRYYPANAYGVIKNPLPSSIR